MRSLLLISLMVLCAACNDDNAGVPGASLTDAADASGAETRRFNDWLDAEFAVEMDFSPLAKTRNGDKSDLGELDDVSEAALERQLQWRRDSVARMRAEFSRAALDSEGQLSWDLWEYTLAQAELNAPFQRHGYIFGRNGPQSGLANSLINYQIVESEDDMRAYISRLQQSGRYLRQYLERAQLAAAEGIRAPHFDYDLAMSEIRRVMNGAPFTDSGESALWTDINGKIAALQEQETIDAAQASAFNAEAQAALLNSLRPALDEILDWLEVDRANVSRIAQGAWALPDGDAYYAARLQTMTTLPMTAVEIHQLGMDEVARIQGEMEAIRRQVGFEGSLQDFFTFMREDEQFYFPNTDQGRADYLSLAEELLETTYARLPEYFGILPKAGLSVRRVEAFREQPGGSAHYARGTADGARPGTFYVHLSDMSASAVNRLENLAYHEGVPGHHLQISIQQELEAIPEFRNHRGYTAFSEGWGLYAEYLGKEMGGYQDPYAELGRLSGEIWRAVRLVVDTGIHALQWTDQQAVDFALQNSPRPESSVRAEVQRYFNNPGQATAYKIGMLKIMELRARAEQELGAAFDIKAFHDQVLGSGQMPMAILDQRIERWIEQVRG